MMSHRSGRNLVVLNVTYSSPACLWYHHCLLPVVTIAHSVNLDLSVQAEVMIDIGRSLVDWLVVSNCLIKWILGNIDLRWLLPLHLGSLAIQLQVNGVELPQHVHVMPFLLRHRACIVDILVNLGLPRWPLGADIYLLGKREASVDSLFLFVINSVDVAWIYVALHAVGDPLCLLVVLLSAYLLDETQLGAIKVHVAWLRIITSIIWTSESVQNNWFLLELAVGFRGLVLDHVIVESRESRASESRARGVDLVSLVIDRSPLRVHLHWNGGTVQKPSVTWTPFVLEELCGTLGSHYNDILNAVPLTLGADLVLVRKQELVLDNAHVVLL